MIDTPALAEVAYLIGDPARARLLGALMDGRALTVSELAGAAGVGLPTASGHVSKLTEAGLLAGERQGRHRYFRLSGPQVAEVLRGLSALARRDDADPVRTGPRDPGLREARVCYGHLAGEYAVVLFDALKRCGLLTDEAAPAVTDKGRAFFAGLGIDTDALAGARRPACRACLDWSERRSHLGGALGGAILDYILAQGWAKRGDGRQIVFSPAGAEAMAARFTATED